MARLVFLISQSTEARTESNHVFVDDSTDFGRELLGKCVTVELP